MRKLHSYEIENLTNQRCTADDWGKIEVAEDFSTDFVENVRFSGINRLGLFKKSFVLENGVVRHSGIFNACLHNCIIENDVYIANIHNVIANYKIKKGCFITNVGTLSVTKGTTFGNGVMVAAVNENGGRKVPIFEELSAQMAHILVFYRQKKRVFAQYFLQIENICQQQKSLDRGVIGEQTKILNCKAIINVKIGAGAFISGIELLENGTVSSNLDARTLVGSGVIAKDFIFGKSSKIADGALIERCFVGEGCLVSKQFSATDCLFFANCEMMNGEAASVFAAPYSVSHHKSSLMIACSLSFANIGSGTNMSNHAYKLGAVHQSVTGRGCKFGSNSYLLSPAQIGAYTMILGSHKNHPDIENLPFSYLIEENGQSVLIPGVNLFRIGTLRDVQKWQNRDKRQGKNHLDLITFDFLNPFIINKIEKGIAILQKLKQEKPDAEIYEFGNCKIHKNSLRKGIEYYKDALIVFLGDFLVNNQNISNLERENFEEWVDLSGMILPKKELEKIEDFAQLNEIFNDYQKYLTCFVSNRCDFSNKAEINQILEKYISILETLGKRLVKEANNEFFGTAKIGYGIDFETEKDADFEQVRGTIENNEFLGNILEELQGKRQKAKG
jgi:carbonic anhydrase/acetyltransferase-like protein (isoleucine patch superfamily)